MKTAPVYIVAFFVVVAFIFLFKILYKAYSLDKRYLSTIFFYLNSFIKTERFVEFYGKDQRFRDLIKEIDEKRIKLFIFGFLGFASAAIAIII